MSQVATKFKVKITLGKVLKNLPIFSLDFHVKKEFEICASINRSPKKSFAQEIEWIQQKIFVKH